MGLPCAVNGLPPSGTTYSPIAVLAVAARGVDGVAALLADVCLPVLAALLVRTTADLPLCSSALTSIASRGTTEFLAMKMGHAHRPTLSCTKAR